MSSKSKTTVLIVVSRLNKGGIARFIESFHKLMIDHEYTFVYAIGHVQDGEEEDEIAMELPIHRVKNLGRKVTVIGDIKAFFELWNIIRKIKPKIIYSHAFKAGILSRLIPCTAASVHVYHGHHLNSPDLNVLKKYIWVNIERILAKRSKILVTTGEQVAIDLIDLKIGKESMYEKVRPYVPDPTPLKKQKFHLLDEIRLDKRVKILWTGRLVPVKQPEKIFELATVLKEYLFIVAGDGELSSLFTNSKYENVVYLGWQSPKLTLALADIVISTSLNEGIPIGIVEATLAEIPVVSTNVGSVSEIIHDGLNGFLYDNVNLEFANKVRELASNESFRKLIGEAGRRFALERFGPEQFVRSQKSIFERAL